MGVAELKELFPYARSPKCRQCRQICLPGKPGSRRPYFKCSFHQHKWGDTFIWNDLIGVDDRNPKCECEQPMRWTPYSDRPGGFYDCAIVRCWSKKHDEPKPGYLEMPACDGYDHDAEILRIKREIPDELRFGDTLEQEDVSSPSTMDFDSPRPQNAELSRSPPRCPHRLATSPPTQAFNGSQAPQSSNRSDMSSSELFVNSEERQVQAPALSAFIYPGNSQSLPPTPRNGAQLATPSSRTLSLPSRSGRRESSPPTPSRTRTGGIRKNNNTSCRCHRSPSSTASVAGRFKDMSFVKAVPINFSPAPGEPGSESSPIPL